MKECRKLVIFIMIGLGLMTSSLTVNAGIVQGGEMSVENQVIPYADKVIKKYRIYEGRKQYRRWNKTRGYWVDPVWINV